MGSNPTWIAVALAIFSIMLSAYSVWFARKTYRETVDRESASRAGRVTAWLAHRYSRDQSGDEVQGGNGVLINNGSNGSIHSLEIMALTKGHETPLALEMCPPGEHYVAWTGFRHDHATCSHRSHPWALLTGTSDYRDQGWQFRPYNRNTEWSVQDLRFSDHAGQRWRRESSGAVTPDTRPPT